MTRPLIAALAATATLAVPSLAHAWGCLLEESFPPPVAAASCTLDFYDRVESGTSGEAPIDPATVTLVRIEAGEEIEIATTFETGTVGLEEHYGQCNGDCVWESWTETVEYTIHRFTPAESLAVGTEIVLRGQDVTGEEVSFSYEVTAGDCELAAWPTAGYCTDAPCEELDECQAEDGGDGGDGGDEGDGAGEAPIPEDEAGGCNSSGTSSSLSALLVLALLVLRRRAR